MKKVYALTLAALVLCLGAQAQAAEDLDKLYGVPNAPSYIKHYEVDTAGNVMISPYLQVGSKAHPAMLDATRPIYNYIITQDGSVALIEEAPHPYGRTYPKGFYRPEDKSQRKAGTTENFGHVSGTAGGPGRISGEIINDTKNKCWVVNNKSGRYSKRNIDRTPEQLANAFALIQESTISDGQPFCPKAVFLVAYAREDIGKTLRNSPDLQYEDLATKKNAHIAITTAAAAPKFAPLPYEHLSLDALKDTGQPEVKKEEKKVEKKADPKKMGGKAAFNDDPS